MNKKLFMLILFSVPSFALDCKGDASCRSQEIFKAQHIVLLDETLERCAFPPDKRKAEVARIRKESELVTFGSKEWKTLVKKMASLKKGCPPIPPGESFK